MIKNIILVKQPKNTVLQKNAVIKTWIMIPAQNTLMP